MSLAPAQLAALRRLTRAAVELRDRVTSDPLSHFDPLPHQLDFLKCTDKKKLLRTGNRLGKTTIGAIETILYALGRHPYDPCPPIMRQWVICASRQQSMTAQEMLYRLARPYLAPGQEWNPKTGLGLHTPKLVFAAEHGGAEVEIKTTRQGAMKLTSAQVGRVWFDEPPESQRLYSEAVNRTRTAGGRVCLTFTPLNADVTWIRKLVDDGKVTDLHYRLTPEAMVHTRSGERYRTDDNRECDAAWIDKVISDQPEHEIPVTIHGEWEFRFTERWFSSFVSAPGVPGSHVHASLPPELDLDLWLGIDHGTGRGNQYAVLLGVEKEYQPTGFRRMWALGEVWHEDIATPTQVAADILARLREWGWAWKDLEGAYGDIDATDDRGTRMGNLDIEDAIRREIGIKVREGLRPRIRSAKRGRGRGAGSKKTGLVWLHQRMVGHDLRVLTSCPTLIEALDKWRNEPKSPHMHPIDGLIYSALHPMLRGPLRESGAVAVLVR